MKDIIPVEHNDVRVLTTEQLAQAYECDARQIKQNFNNNSERFIEGKHFFKLEGAELKAFKNKVENFDLVGKNANILILWTRQGASRHCKMLGTDRAWEMFDELEENYFNPRPRQLSQLEILQGSINQLVEHERDIARLKLHQEEQDKQMSVLNSRMDTLNGVCPDGDKQQKLNAMVKLYTVKKGIRFDEGWKQFRQMYNTAFRTNVNLSKTHFMEQHSIKKMSIPEFLMRAGHIDDALRVADKMLQAA